MLCVGFEPTIPVFEQAKAVHALERAATVIDRSTPKWLMAVHAENHMKHK
jgi:hypothetical protein